MLGIPYKQSMKMYLLAITLTLSPVVLSVAQPSSGPFPVPPGTNTSVGFATQATNVVGGTIQGTIFNSRAYPSNIYHLSNEISGTVGNTLFTSTHHAFAGLNRGDNFVTTNDSRQYKITRIVDDNTINVFPPASSTYTQQTNCWVYPNALAFKDINGVDVGGLGNDGTILLRGSTAGNSVSLMFVDDVANVWNWQIGNGGSLNLSFSTNALAQQPNPVQIDPPGPANVYQSLWVQKDGTIAVRQLTNSPGNGFGYLPIYGNVVISSNATVGEGLALSRRSTPPTFAELGSLTNVIFMWNSNPIASTTPTNWMQYYATPSTLTTIRHDP